MGIRGSAILTASLAGALLLGSFASVTKAELSIDEIRGLLQESLTITEIDRELSRIESEEATVHNQIMETEAEIVKQNENMLKARDRAGKVLRSYYMGERDSLWILLLHANSFSDALSVFEYLRYIAKSDTNAMERFAEAHRELEHLNAQLNERQTELQNLKESFLSQRERLVALQAELDKKLREAEDAEALLARMEALNLAWQRDGLPMFRQFLDAMSEAMLQLPDYLEDNEDALKQSGRTFTFTVKEDALNLFLREQNDLFDRYVYSLMDDQILIAGEQGETAITVKGHFQIETEPEEALRFMLDELTYNAFILPDTTIADMQKQFRMTFYPDRNDLTSLLQLSSVEMNEGEFIIVMKLSL